MTRLEFLINMDFFEQQQKKKVGNLQNVFYVCMLQLCQKTNFFFLSTDHYLADYISEKNKVLGGPEY